MGIGAMAPYKVMTLLQSLVMKRRREVLTCGGRTKQRQLSAPKEIGLATIAPGKKGRGALFPLAQAVPEYIVWDSLSLSLHKAY